MAERETADAIAAESGNIAVTGQLARRQNMASSAQKTVVTAEDAYTDFHEKLQSAFQANSRKAILGLIGYPLEVNFNGNTRTYRTRSDVERDYDRIFTAAVRESVLGGQIESGFCPSSIGLAGPGSLLLRSGPSAPTTLCNAAKPPAAATLPRKFRQVKMLMISWFSG